MSKPVVARGGGFGLDAELAKKLSDKYDPLAESTVRKWIADVTGDAAALDGSQSLGQVLKNGQLLCKLVNDINPGQIKKIETSSMPFKQMENISQFLKAARALGVAEFDVFETVDLFDEKDLGSVVRCVLALSRAVQKSIPSFTGPYAVFQGATNVTGAAPLECKSNPAPASVKIAPSSFASSSSSAATIGSPAPKLKGEGGDSTVFSSFEKMKVDQNKNSPTVSTPNTNTNSAAAPVPIGSRGAGFGLDAELAQKKADKYDQKSEDEVKVWIESITGDKFDAPFAAKLKNGELLCKLINCIKPGSIPKVNQSTMPFKQMENITSFLRCCRNLGVSGHDLFETVDLYEEKDLGLVVLCLFALGRTVQVTIPEFNGPTLGPKLAEANKRSFTSEQLAAGKAVQSKISAGSSMTMDRTYISSANTVTFGAETVGVGDSGSINLINNGSAATMSRSDINVSTSNITFGADAATGKLPNLGNK